LNLAWQNVGKLQPPAFLLEISLDINANAFPKTMFGNPITKMEPGSK